MPQPLVSVITPTFNHERFIEACLKSVLDQSYANVEQIVIDDGSTDRTAEIAEAAAGPRTKVLRAEHKGIDRLAESYNEALAKAQGEFIAILEGDDLFPAAKLSAQMAHFDDPDVSFCWGALGAIDSNSNPVEIQVPAVPHDAVTNSPLGRASLEAMLPTQLTFAFPVTWVIRRSALDSIGGFQSFPGLPLVDFPTLLALGLTGKWAHESSVCGIWRRHAASTTSNRLSNILDGAYRCATSFFAEHHSELPNAGDWASTLDIEWRSFQARRAALLGRLRAQQGDQESAKQFFRRAAEICPRSKRKILYQVLSVGSPKWLTEQLFKFVGEQRVQSQSSINSDLMINLSARPEDIEVHNLHLE